MEYFYYGASLFPSQAKRFQTYSHSYEEDERSDMVAETLEGIDTTGNNFNSKDVEKAAKRVAKEHKCSEEAPEMISMIKKSNPDYWGGSAFVDALVNTYGAKIEKSVRNKNWKKGGKQINTMIEEFLVRFKMGSNEWGMLKQGINEYLAGKVTNNQAKKLMGGAFKKIGKKDEKQVVGKKFKSLNGYISFVLKKYGKELISELGEGDAEDTQEVMDDMIKEFLKKYTYDSEEWNIFTYRVNRYIKSKGINKRLSNAMNIVLEETGPKNNVTEKKKSGVGFSHGFLEKKASGVSKTETPEKKGGKKESVKDKINRAFTQDDVYAYGSEIDVNEEINTDDVAMDVTEGYGAPLSKYLSVGLLVAVGIFGYLYWRNRR